MLSPEYVALTPPTQQRNPNSIQPHSMLSAHAPTFTPAADQVDHVLIREKRLQKFLLNCAKVGAQAPLPLNAAKQDNATFDTMLEVAAECEITGIPTPHRPYACPLPPFPPLPRRVLRTAFGTSSPTIKLSGPPTSQSTTVAAAPTSQRSSRPS